MNSRKQRHFMARLYAEHRGDPEAVVRAYAAAEDRGEVDRQSNKYGLGSVAYAKALLADGVRKGWLK